MYRDDLEQENQVQDAQEVGQEKKELENQNSIEKQNHEVNQETHTSQNSYSGAPQNSYSGAPQNSYGSAPQDNYRNRPQNHNPYGNMPQGNYGNTWQSSYGNNQQDAQHSSGSTQQNGYVNPPYSYGNSSGYQQQNTMHCHSAGHTNYGQQYAPWQQPGSSSSVKPDGHKKKPFPPLVKKTAGIMAAALLFGVVAGSAMTGVRLLSDYFTVSEKQEPVTVSQAETLPAVKTPAEGNSAPAVTTGMNDVSAIVERAMPSVVAIQSVTQHEVQNWFGQSQIYEGKGSGSGIIIGESDTELLVVTNKHVIEGAVNINVGFCDNESVEAHIKGTDSENDLAVLAVSLEKISDDTKSKIAIATLGDSDALKVGQGVIAIGNALGYGQSVTVGYVSALDREVHTDEMTTRNLLQTDAAINPGNSGGALLNMQGEVIGINSAKYSSTDVEGMGYAIPISKVSNIIGDLMTMKTRVQIDQDKQGYLGIQGTDIDSNTSNLYGMPQGIFVYKIVEGGAAAASDLREKDIITKFDGQSVKTMAELKNLLLYYAGGDSIELTVQSLKEGEYVERQVVVTLGTRPAEEQIN